MTRALAATVVAIILVSACTSVSGGNGDCDGPHLSPLPTSASDRALSCAENVFVNGVQYIVDCLPVPRNRLGPELAAGEGYVARSITKLAIADAIAVGQPELDRSGKGGPCGRWTISPSVELDRRARNELLQRAEGAFA
jgi:hypothetical protein